jgi:hypothetical protein
VQYGWNVKQGVRIQSRPCGKVCAPLHLLSNLELSRAECSPSSALQAFCSKFGISRCEQSILKQVVSKHPRLRLLQHRDHYPVTTSALHHPPVPAQVHACNTGQVRLNRVTALGIFNPTHVRAEGVTILCAFVKGLDTHVCGVLPKIQGYSLTILPQLCVFNTAYPEWFAAPIWDLFMACTTL